MAPRPPTQQEKEAKQKAKAEQKSHPQAEGQENGKESSSPILMNPDGSYTSQGALAPESPYATAPEAKPTPSAVTTDANQALPPTGIFNPSLIPAPSQQTTNAFKTGFNAASGPSTTSFSSQSSAFNGFGISSKPASTVTFGQRSTSSLPQQAKTSNFGFAPTSSPGFDLKFKSTAPQLSFPPPNLPVNANANLIPVKSLNEIFGEANTQGSEATSFAGIPGTNPLFASVDLGMRMRNCLPDDPHGLNKCILEMNEKDDAAKAKLREATTTIQAKDSCILILEGDNATIKNKAQTVYDQQAKALAAKDAEIAKLKAADSAVGNANGGILKGVEKDLEAKDSQITELSRKLQAAENKEKDLEAKDSQITELHRKLQAAENKEKDLEAKDSQITELRRKLQAAEDKEKDLEAKNRWITELRRQLEAAENKEKALVRSHDREKLKLKRESEEKEIIIEDFRASRDGEIKQIEALRQQANDASIKAKHSEEYANDGDNRVQEQAETIKESQAYVRLLQASIERREQEIRDNREEIESIKLQKDNPTEDHRDCNAKLRRLEAEKKQEMDELETQHKLQLAEHAEATKEEFSRLQAISDDVGKDIDKLRLQVQDDEHTIRHLRQGNRQLESEAADYKKLATRGNELSDFSPAISRSVTPASPPGPWRPQTESMMGDSDDSDDEGQRPVKLDYFGPRTVANFEPSDGSSDHKTATSTAAGKGLGIADVSLEMYDQGTQTDGPPSSAGLSNSQTTSIGDFTSTSSGLSISKPMVIVNTIPSSPPKSSISNSMTVMDNTRSSSPRLGISKVSTIIDTKPSGTEFSMSQPMSIVNETPSPPQKLGISKPVTIIDHSPSSPVELGLSKLQTVIDLPPNVPTLGISIPMTPTSNPMMNHDETQPPAPKLGISDIATIIDYAPDVPDPVASSDSTTVENTPSSTAVIAEPAQQLIQKSSSGRRWLWYLLLLLIAGLVIVTAFYGLSARRERNMWLEANDFTRRAVYSVQAGGGTGMSVPAWLWNDSLLGK
ncbi:MAG: hypothetical protein Q9168_007233 [Polycauliona sp. 1 TL-2023]